MSDFKSFIKIIIFTILIVLCILPFEISHSQVQRGQKAPVFNLRNTYGELIKPFHDINKSIVLSFFFTECAKCKHEIKNLHELYKKYNTVIDVYLVGTSFKKNIDAVTDVKNYINEIGVDFVPLVDKYTEVIKAYKIFKYPTVLIIEKNGSVSHIFDTFNDNTFSEIENIVKKYR